MNTNIKLFSLVLFKVSPVDEKPIMFDHGDNVTFTTKTLISPSPSGLLELAKRVHNLAVETSRKREEQEVEKALQSTINKKKKAHDEFHKFVRSL